MSAPAKRLTSLGAALGCALALGGCGGDDSSGSGAGDAGGNPTDRAFAAEMIPHHRSAIEMAEIGRRRAESPFVRQLADDIVRTQTAEISTLRREDSALADEGVKKGSLELSTQMMGMDGDTKRLRTATPFDEPFLKMMIPHHQGAIDMAKVELARGGDLELKALAQSIIDGQQREIDRMEEAVARG